MHIFAKELVTLATHRFKDLCLEVSRPIVKMLKAAGGNFCLDMAQQLREGRIPSNNAKRIVIEIMAKQKSGSHKIRININKMRLLL